MFHNIYLREFQLQQIKLLAVKLITAYRNYAKPAVVKITR